MMSLYLVTDQYEPYMPSSHQCTGSSRRRRSKYGYQMSSWYSFGLLTSSLSSGSEHASSVASKCTGAFIGGISWSRARYYSTFVLAGSTHAPPASGRVRSANPACTAPSRLLALTQVQNL